MLIFDVGTVDQGMQQRGSQRRTTSARAHRKTGLWSTEELQQALAAVDEGHTMRRAAIMYNIPYTSFREWCYGVRMSRKKGPPSVLSPAEEEELVTYLMEMCDRGYGLTPTALRMKVYEITQSRWTPFRNGIPGNGWMRWWKRRHPELTLRVSQALEGARAKGLCEDNVRSFYENLQQLYDLHKYTPDKIWNCDETGAQAGRNGGAIVIARRGARRVQSIVPNQREWLSVLVCINASGSAIPAFYIFRGRRFRQNYIEKCEAGATMAMQQRAWMTTYLFSAWISHFIASVRRECGISPENRHLLILDGHNSHVTLDVVMEARAAGLDLLTLPAHTSHALQPLDVGVFKSFKQYFREYRDFWSSRHLNEAASKDTLAQWVSLGLRRALNPNNIKKGFSATGILPLNFNAVQEHMRPSQTYRYTEVQEPQQGEGPPEASHEPPTSGTVAGSAREEPEGNEHEERNVPDIQSADIEAELAEVPDSSAVHFFVDADLTDPTIADEVVGLEQNADAVGSITQFLTLPTVAARINPRKRDPILDFSKSIMLTSEQYINAAAQMKEAKVTAARQKEQARVEKEERKKRKETEREEERLAKEARASEIAEARAQKAAEREEARAVKAARAAEAAAVKATKAAEREEAQRQKAERAIQALEERARKEADKAHAAAERAHRQSARAAETTHVRQFHHNSTDSYSHERSSNFATWNLQLEDPNPSFPGFATLSSALHSPVLDPLYRRT